MSGKFTNKFTKGSRWVGHRQYSRSAPWASESASRDRQRRPGLRPGLSHPGRASCVVVIPDLSTVRRRTNCWYNDDNDYRCPPGG